MDSPFFFMCHRVPWSVSLLDDTESVGCVAQNIGRERDIFILFGCRCCYMWTCTKGRGGKKITSAEVRRFRILWRSWKGEAVCVCVLTDLRVVWHTTRVPSKNFCPSLPFPLGPARKERKKKELWPLDPPLLQQPPRERIQQGPRDTLICATKSWSDRLCCRCRSWH